MKKFHLKYKKPLPKSSIILGNTQSKKEPFQRLKIFRRVMVYLI